jgi:hypothetical protein
MGIMNAGKCKEKRCRVSYKEKLRSRVSGYHVKDNAVEDKKRSK